MNISFKYDDDVWQVFRAVVKERYGVDASAALKRLIDHVARTGEIPGLAPLLSVESGDYKNKITEERDNASQKVSNQGDRGATGENTYGGRAGERNTTGDRTSRAR